jgi:hypothetical protein
MNKESNIDNQAILVAPQNSPEDEISLIDLWLILVRRKHVFQACMLIGIAVSITLALTAQEQYRFHTAIVLGKLTMKSSTQEDATNEIETPETAVAKLEQGYIPQTLILLEKSLSTQETYKFKASAPNNSNLVIIETIGSKENKNTYFQILKDSSNALVQDHDKVIAPTRSILLTSLKEQKLKLGNIRDDELFAVETNTIDQKINNKKLNLLALGDQRKITKNQHQQIDLEIKLANKQREEIKHTLKTAISYRTNSMKENEKPTTAVTLLMLGNEIQHYQSRIAELDHLIHISLPQKRSELQKEIEDNTRTQQQQDDLIADLNDDLRKTHLDRKNQENYQLLGIELITAEISALRPTHILYKPSQSQAPVSKGRTLKATLGLILSLFIAIFISFAAELLEKARNSTLTSRSQKG